VLAAFGVSLFRNSDKPINSFLVCWSSKRFCREPRDDFSCVIFPFGGISGRFILEEEAIVVRRFGPMFWIGGAGDFHGVDL
jgi:hypothetical protein